jgi:hypothetical protein
MGILMVIGRVPQTMALEQVHFLKDLALAGAALVMFVAFVALGSDVNPVITGPPFNLGGDQFVRMRLRLPAAAPALSPTGHCLVQGSGFGGVQFAPAQFGPLEVQPDPELVLFADDDGPGAASRSRPPGKRPGL